MIFCLRAFGTQNQGRGIIRQRTSQPWNFTTSFWFYRTFKIPRLFSWLFLWSLKKLDPRLDFIWDFHVHLYLFTQTFYIFQKNSSESGSKTVELYFVSRKTHIISTQVYNFFLKKYKKLKLFCYSGFRLLKS